MGLFSPGIERSSGKLPFLRIGHPGQSKKGEGAMTKLLIIRGLPGSGKSTLAAEMAPNACFEADAYMVDASGKYEFDPSRLAEVHEKCFQAVREALVAGTPVVAVANTFTRTWEFAKYIDLAQELGADHEIIVCTGSYGNIHGVSPEMVQRMRERWEA